jgi:UPF0716 family protein affecting phage T7 exclusion
MRRLIESLTPGERPISWKWIGSMLAFYVVVMAAAAGLFASHQSRANLAHEAGTTVAAGRMQPASAHTRGLAPRLAGFNPN